MDKRSEEDKLTELKEMLIGVWILKNKSADDWEEYRSRNDKQWIWTKGMAILLTEEMIELMMDKSEDELWEISNEFICPSREVQRSMIRLGASVSNNRLGRGEECSKRDQVIAVIITSICCAVWLLVERSADELNDETIDYVVDLLLRLLKCGDLKMVKWAILTGEKLWVKMKTNSEKRDALRTALTRNLTHSDTLEKYRDWLVAERYQDWCARWCKENLLEDGLEEMPLAKLSPDRSEVRNDKKNIIGFHHLPDRYTRYSIIEPISLDDSTVFKYLTRTLTSTPDQWTQLFVFIALDNLKLKESEKKTILENEQISMKLFSNWKDDRKFKDFVELVSREKFDFIIPQLRLITALSFQQVEVVTHLSRATLNMNDRTNQLKLSSDCLLARSDFNRQSVRSKCHVAKGSYYFEAVLLTNGPMRIGWSTKRTELDKTEVGEDQFSIGFDGYNRCVWHNNEELKLETNISRWRAGDVIGCLFEVTNTIEKEKKRKSYFYLNGQLIIYKIKSPIYYSPQPYHVSISLSSHQQAYINFGQTKFKYSPQKDYLTFFNSPQKASNQISATNCVIDFSNSKNTNSLVSTGNISFSNQKTETSSTIDYMLNKDLTTDECITCPECHKEILLKRILIDCCRCLKLTTKKPSRNELIEITSTTTEESDQFRPNLEFSTKKSTQTVSSFELSTQNAIKTVSDLELSIQNAIQRVPSLELSTKNAIKPVSSLELSTKKSTQTVPSLEFSTQNANKTVSSLELSTQYANKTVSSLELSIQNANKTVSSLELSTKKATKTVRPLYDLELASPTSINLLNPPIEFTHKWFIQKFDFLFNDNKAALSVMYSETFPVSDKIMFSLRMVPAYSEGNEIFVSMFLYLERCQLKNDSISVTYEISILNIEPDKSHSRTETKQFQVEKFWGWKKFIKRSELMDSSKGYLINDSLSIVCKVEILSENEQIAISNNQTENYFDCNLNVNQIRYFWEIPKFDSFLRSKNREIKYVQSDIFPTKAQNRYFLRMWPKGIDEIVKDYVSMFLYLESSSGDKMVDVNYRLSILDSDGDVYHTGEGRGTLIPFETNSKDDQPIPVGKGSSKYIALERILNPENGLLPNFRLTIYCEIEEKIKQMPQLELLTNELKSLQLNSRPSTKP